MKFKFNAEYSESFSFNISFNITLKDESDEKYLAICEIYPEDIQVNKDISESGDNTGNENMETGSRRLMSETISEGYVGYVHSNCNIKPPYKKILKYLSDSVVVPVDANYRIEVSNDFSLDTSPENKEYSSPDEYLVTFRQLGGFFQNEYLYLQN